MDLIQTDGPQKQFLEFFVAICSCGGKRILSNQEACLAMIVLNPARRRSLLLSTSNLEDSTVHYWHSKSDEIYKKKHRGKLPPTVAGSIFLGKEEWASGFPDVYVNWFGCKDWKPGKDELFYSPRVFGLPIQEGVSAIQVC
jgi:hypothetical protein